MNKSFNNVLANFQRLSDDRSKQFTGGGGVDTLLQDLFNNIFNLSSQTLTADMKQVFIQQVTDLAGTPVGHSLLEKLLSAGHSLSVVGDMPSQSSASAEYDRVGNVLKIGNLNVNTSDPYYPAGANYSIISHELWHAYTDLYVFGDQIGTYTPLYNSQIRNEVDASIFSYMASIQYDIANNLSYDSDGSHIRTATTLVKANPITDSEKAVERAWNDIFHNNNLSVENFNTIITNFQTGSAYVGNTGKQFDPVANVSEFHSRLFYLENNGYMYDIKLFNAMSNDHFTAPKALVDANPDLRNTPKPQWMWSNDDWLTYNAGITPSGVTQPGGGGGGNSPSGIYNPTDPLWTTPAPGSPPYRPDLPNYNPSLPLTWFDSNGNYHPEWGRNPRIQPGQPQGNY